MENLNIRLQKEKVSSMKKVVFCEVAWMKYYSGITNDDKPINGGKYIDENGDGGEIYNFSPYNHKCYGYVMHKGDELHIERYDKILKSFDEVHDITVVWVASDGESSKIVGWYEHAIMYRFWQTYYDIQFSGDRWNDYNFVANEKDCYLIDEKDRSFVIPRASIAGRGKGMGQSQVWYAESSYAQMEFIPKVLEYLESMRDKCKPVFFSTEKISASAKDEGQSVQGLLKKCEEICKDENCYISEALGYANLAINKQDCYDTRFWKAEILNLLGLYDEAEEEYKKALYHEENLHGMAGLMYVEIMLGHTFLAIDLGEKIRTRKTEYDGWVTVACNLVHLYISEGELNCAGKLITECKNEKNSGAFDWLTDAKKRLDESKGTQKKG